MIVELADGEVVRSRTAVVAVAPKTACDLLGVAAGAPLARWTASSVPIKAACLDVALDRLERPRQRFALGLDRPFLLFRAFGRREAGTGGDFGGARDEVSATRRRALGGRVDRAGTRGLPRPAPAGVALAHGRRGVTCRV